MTIFRDRRNGLLYLVWQVFGWTRGYVAEPYGHTTPAKHRRGGSGIAPTVDLRHFTPVSYR